MTSSVRGWSDRFFTRTRMAASSARASMASAMLTPASRLVKVASAVLAATVTFPSRRKPSPGQTFCPSFTLKRGSGSTFTRHFG